MNELIIAKEKKRAQKLIDKVQKRIKSRGAYENAGQNEIRQFTDTLPKELHYTERCELIKFIDDGMDNLEY